MSDTRDDPALKSLRDLTRWLERQSDEAERGLARMEKDPDVRALQLGLWRGGVLSYQHAAKTARRELDAVEGKP